MRLQYAEYTNIGKRSSNEDSLGVFENDGSFFAIVADGLGGYTNGEVASQIALRTISSELMDKSVDEDELAYAIIRASEICRAGTTGKTTVATLWISNGYAVAANVGDTRIYQFRDGDIIYQSVDHSVVQMAVLVGELSPDAIRNHKDRNVLFRVLGEDETPKVDSTQLVVKPGDRFLLCSDGFGGPVIEDAMTKLGLETSSAQEWLDSMVLVVEETNSPTQDNYSAICILAN